MLQSATNITPIDNDIEDLSLRRWAKQKGAKQDHFVGSRVQTQKNAAPRLYHKQKRTCQENKYYFFTRSSTDCGDQQKKTPSDYH
jgi:Tfp pilus assembly major pilin PilA